MFQPLVSSKCRSRDRRGWIKLGALIIPQNKLKMQKANTNKNLMTSVTPKWAWLMVAWCDRSELIFIFNQL